MKNFKIADCQIPRYFHDGEVFESIQDAWSELAGYHNVDFDMTDDNDKEYESIYDYMDEKFKTDQERLDWLLDYGKWEIEEVEGIKCPLCGNFIEHDEYEKLNVWSCHTCPFIGMEFYSEKNIASLIKYLNEKNN